MHMHKMIEFVVKDRKMRLYPDETITVRAVNRGNETVFERWKPIKFSSNGKGYLKCNLAIDGRYTNLYKHRLIYLAHNPDWDIFGGHHIVFNPKILDQ